MHEQQRTTIPTDQPGLAGPGVGAAEAPASRRAVLARGVLLAIAGLVPGARASAATKKKTTRRTTRKTVKKATAATTAPAVAGATGGTFDPRQELVISVTYRVADGSPMVKNPYLVAFVVDADGALVRTVGLSVQTTGRGLRYIDRLSEWNMLDQARIAEGGADTLMTISSATRMPSTWRWAWDGRDDRRNLVPKGDYLVVIEASREHGPYSVIHEPVRIDGTVFVQKPADSNELTAASIELRAR